MKTSVMYHKGGANIVSNIIVLVQSSQTAFQEQHINGPELGDDELFSALNDDMAEGMEGMGDFNDIFNVWPEAGAGGGQSPGGSPHRPEGSPLGGDGGGSGLGNHDGPGSPFPCSNTPRVSSEETKTFTTQNVAVLSVLNMRVSVN